MKYCFSLIFLFFSWFLFAQNLQKKAEQELDALQPNAIKTILEIEKKFGENDIVLLLKSRHYQNIGEFNKSILYARKGLKINKVNPGFVKQLMINNFLLGQLDSAIYYGQNLLKKKLNDQERSRALVLVSNAHWELGNQKYAQEGYEKALKFGKACGDSNSISTAMNGLGLIYFDNKTNLNKAITYFQQAIQYTPSNRPLNKANYQLNIAGALIKKQTFENVNDYLSKAEETANLLGDLELLFSCYVNKGIVNTNQNNLLMSELYLSKANKLIKTGKVDSSKGESLFLALSDLAFKKRDFKTSVENYRKYFSLYEKRVNDEKNKKILVLQEQFNASQKQKEIAELKIKNQETEIERKKIDASYFKARFIIILLLFIIAVISTIGYFIYRKRKLKIHLENEKEKRKAILEAVEKEKYRFSRELHDSLGGTLSMSKLMVSQFNDTENVSKIESLLQIAIDDTRRISRDLYPTVLKVSGLKAALGNLFENLQHANKLMEFDFDMAELDYSLGDSFSLHIYRICQELTNNTIKYANAKNAVLEIDFDELTMLLRYRDNGIGIDMSNYKTGVGMNSIQERLAALDGQINIISTPGTGFEVRITAPLEVSAISKEN